MVLKPQDVLIVLKIAIHKGAPWSYGSLGKELGMSASEAHAAVRRALHAGLLKPQPLEPVREALLEFLVHGARYAFAPERGGITRGVPTAHAAPPLEREIKSGDLPPVWPSPEGTARGEAFSPLYKSAVIAAQRDTRLYWCLALVDALRGGRARERKLAEQHLRRLLLA